MKAGLDTDRLVDLEVSLDVILFVFSLVNFYCLSGALICLSNHWDAKYEVTGEVRDRRIHVRLVPLNFNN